MSEMNHEQDSREPTEEEVSAFLDSLPGKLTKEDKALLASLPWSLEELTKEQTPESLKQLVACLTVNLAFIHAHRRGNLTEEEREILVKRKEQLASLPPPEELNKGQKSGSLVLYTCKLCGWEELTEDVIGRSRRRCGGCGMEECKPKLIPRSNYDERILEIWFADPKPATEKISMREAMRGIPGKPGSSELAFGLFLLFHGVACIIVCCIAPVLIIIFGPLAIMLTGGGIYNLRR